uniref:Uncharacterized protein n=1 Tax=Anopheles darlingi TaxID=43151 RepID=A0A2M4D599_ANODA
MVALRCLVFILFFSILQHFEILSLTFWIASNIGCLFWCLWFNTLGDKSLFVSLSSYFRVLTEFKSCHFVRFCLRITIFGIGFIVIVRFFDLRDSSPFSEFYMS